MNNAPTNKPDGFTIARQLIALKALEDTLAEPTVTAKQRTLKHEMLFFLSQWRRDLEALLADSEVIVGVVPGK